MQKIEEVVNKVLEAMRMRGLGEYTLKCVNWSIYRPFVNWHHKNGTEYYSEKLLDELCKHQEARYMQGEITRKFYRSFVTAAFRIRSYMDTGVVDFSVVKDARWFKPNEENQGIADTVLERTGLKDGYRKKLSIPIRHLFCFMEKRGKSASQITEKDLRDFISEAAKTNRNNMSIVMRAVKFVTAYLNEQQFTKIETDWGVFRPATSPLHLIAPYTQEEITRMLDVIDSHSKTPLRDKAMILLAFNSGLRGVDIRNLKLSDIYWEKKEIRIVQSKTGSPLASPLQGKTLNAIADYILQERPQCESDCVFIRSYPAYTGLSSTSPLSSLLVCGKCGSPYRRATWNIRGKKKIVWRCASRLDFGTKYCKDSPSIEETALQDAVMRAISEQYLDREQDIALLTANLERALAPEAHGDENALRRRLAELQAEKQALIAEALDEKDDGKYDFQFARIMQEMESVKAQLGEIEADSHSRKLADSRMAEIQELLADFQEKPLAFDDVLVRKTVAAIHVLSKEEIEITFVDGQMSKVRIKR